MHLLARELLVPNWTWRVSAEQIGQLSDLGGKRVVVDVEVSSKQQRLQAPVIPSASIYHKAKVSTRKETAFEVLNSWYTSCWWILRLSTKLRI